jgi:polyisoprenoid-binding protein YceI
MSRYTWLVVPFCCGILATSLAHGQAPPEKIDVQNSRVYVFVDKNPRGHQHGVEGKLTSGTVRLGQATAAGEMTFDMASFQVDSDAARRYVGLDADTEEADQVSATNSMRDATVLDIAKFATAKFTIDSIKPVQTPPGVAGVAYEFAGELDLHGVKKKFGFVAAAEAIEGGKTRIRGHFPLKQTDFGIKPFTKLFGAIGVADEVRVYGDIYLVP